MPDPRSPLESLLVSGRFGAAPAVVIGARTPVSLWQASGWGDFDAAAQPLLSTLGFSAPADYRTAIQASGMTLRKTAPDRMLIEGCTDLANYASDALALLDLSHARSVITLSGPAARTVLTQLCSVDVRAKCFRPGEFIQTGIHDVGVLIQCAGEDDFEFYVPVTWAVTVFETIRDNAEPFGYAIKSDDREGAAKEN